MKTATGRAKSSRASAANKRTRASAVKKRAAPKATAKKPARMYRTNLQDVPKVGGLKRKDGWVDMLSGP